MEAVRFDLFAVHGYSHSKTGEVVFDSEESEGEVRLPRSEWEALGYPDHLQVEVAS